MLHESSLPVPRSTLAVDRGVALFALGILGARAVWGGALEGAWVFAPAIASVTLGAVAVRIASPRARSIAALTACLLLAMRIPVPWQAVMGIALAAFALLGRVVPGFAPPPRWWAPGRVPLGWTALVGGVTPVALIGWVVLFHPNLRDVVGAYVPHLPLPVLIAGGVGFSFVNAALEELIWRGVLQDRLEPLFGAAGAIVVSSISFGVQHARGVPRGAIGVLLAGSWAVMLGMLRKHTRGMLAPFLSHVIADATIAVIILTLASRP
jgi:membrane protease YdiL (CAAX protease family)